MYLMRWANNKVDFMTSVRTGEPWFDGKPIFSFGTVTLNMYQLPIGLWLIP